MSYKVEINETADIDIQDATNWYEVKRTGLGVTKICVT